MTAPSLDDLADVDWKSIQHSYGPAIDTPGHLRALLADDPAKRSEAYGNLESSIWHQGYQITEASLAALPYLIRLAAWPALAEKDRLLWLIYGIANGNGWFQGQQQFEHVRELHGNEKIAEEVAKEERLQARIAETIQAGRDTWMSLLEAEDGVAIQALRLLCTRRRDPDAAVFDKLKLGLPGYGPSAQAESMLAMPLLAREHAIPLLHEYADSDFGGVSLAAIVGLLRMGQTIDADALEFVSDTIENYCDRKPNFIAEIVLEPVGLLCFLGRSLTFHAADDAEALIQRLLPGDCEVLTLDDPRLVAILSLAANPEGEPFPEGHLRPIQIQALSAIARPPWLANDLKFMTKHMKGLSPCFSAFSLPTTPQGMEALLHQ